MMIPNYRAWDKSRKLMGDVDSIKFSEVQHMQVKYRINDNGKVIDEWSNLDDDGCGTCVLMQSTGLKDKNGVEIYEGDIVKVFDSVQVNEIDHGGAFVDAHFDELDEVDYIAFSGGGFKLNRTGFDVSICQDVEEFRVIGNIYENPELLEETK